MSSPLCFPIVNNCFKKEEKTEEKKENCEKIPSLWRRISIRPLRESFHHNGYDINIIILSYAYWGSKKQTLNAVNAVNNGKELFVADNEKEK